MANEDENEGGSGGLIFLLFLMILLMALGFWSVSAFDQATYKYSFGSSDLSYKPGAALMSA